MSDELVVHVNIAEAGDALTPADVGQAVIAVAETEGIDHGEISITFVNAATISTLNETHLGVSGPTDVISFNLENPKAPLADVYICPEIAAQSSQEHGIELREELLRLVIHGMLHVAGYDHPEGPERVESDMFIRQETILKQIL